MKCILQQIIIIHSLGRVCLDKYVSIHHTSISCLFCVQDAHEFLRLCLDILQQDVAKINMKVSEKVEALTDDNNLFDNGAIISDEVKLQCPVSSNFSFKVKNQITCEK